MNKTNLDTLLHARSGSESQPGKGYGGRGDRRRNWPGHACASGSWPRGHGGRAEYLADKIVGLRIFEDDAGKMNRSVAEIGGAVLAVSQFTLFGDVRRGKRPSFDDAAQPEMARTLYERFVSRVRASGLRCETGRFQEMMEVELVNDGPVTILLDSEKLF
jgi:D-aminoacyl-tRNA deacylase